MVILQAYGTNLSVSTGDLITLNTNVAIGNVKRDTSTPTVININKPGIYKVEFNATGTTTTAGTFGVQMYLNGSAVTQAQASMTTSTAGDIAAVSFNSIVDVSAVTNGTTSIPMTFSYTGGVGTITLANAVVTKIS